MSTTTTAYTIKNHTALASYAKRFTPAVTQGDEAPIPPSSADFFGSMNMSNNVELDSGPFATIDVQPDFRRIVAYICFYVASIYPEYNVKGHPFVSTFSIIGYCLLLVNAHLLSCDLTARRTKSYFSLPFTNDAHLKDYLNVLLNARIPSFLIPLLEQLAPTFDPRRVNIEFIPSLAGFSLTHDLGRFPHALQFFQAHHQVASTRANAEPEDLLARYYGLLSVTHGTSTYYNGNIFGTHYNNGTNVVSHSNWFNQIFESIYNPVVGRFLTARPTFAKMNLTPYSEVPTAFNPYIYALCATDENIPIMQDFVNATSRFFASEDSKTFSLGSLFSTLSGITILNHSIEPVTLPTWSNLTVAASNNKTTAPTSAEDAKTFATKHKFLADPKTGTSTLKYPADTKDIETGLYLVQDKTFDPTKTNVPVIKFDLKTHLSPYVFYFQPYDVSPSSLAFTVALGILIEVAEIDGLTTPTPDHAQSLEENNSQYLQGSLSLSKIRRINTLDTTVRIRERTVPDSVYQKIGFAFRDMSRNVLPFFTARNNVTATTYGLKAEDNHADGRTAITYAAGYSNETSYLEDHFVYGWSSYRIVTKHKALALTDIRMLLSFRPFYGSNITLSRSKNPVSLMPK